LYIKPGGFVKIIRPPNEEYQISPRVQEAKSGEVDQLEVEEKWAWAAVSKLVLEFEVSVY